MLRTQIVFQFQNLMPMNRSARLHVLAAVLAWLPAKILLLCFLFLPRFLSWRFSRKDKWKENSARWIWLHKWMPKDSAIAPTPVPAKQYVRKEFLSLTLQD